MSTPGGPDDAASIRAFVVTVPIDDADVASDRLWQLGVRAVEERTGGGGAVELWTAVGEDDVAIERAAGTLDPRWSWRTETVSTVSAQTWRDHARPTWITDDLVIVPAWLDLGAGVDESVTQILVEPAGAFGLGDHPTSQLTARALRRELLRRTGASAPGERAPGEPAGGVSVLDVGCGTGVLSVVAARSGAGSVRALDVSAEAVAATEANAQRNDVAATIEVDDTVVGDIEGSFDVVVANILAPVLVALAADLSRLTASDGVLVVSGILADAHEHVVAALRPMVAVEVEELGSWAAVTFRH